MKKLLYIFDDINYESGARNAMIYQIDLLKDLFDISVFSLAKPKDLKIADGVKVVGSEIWDISKALSGSLIFVLKSREYSVLCKFLRFFYSFIRRTKFENLFLNQLYKQIKQLFEEFDTIIVVSEASKLRWLVAGSIKPKKIQWIHTDYAAWINFTSWTRAITKNDRKLYQKFDVIVALSESCRQGIQDILPVLKEKINVIPNLIDYKKICMMSEEDNILPANEVFCLLTIGRLEAEKSLTNIINLSKRLKNETKKFLWYIIGDGSQKKMLEKNIMDSGLNETIVLLGHIENPYSILKSCDCFVLLSEYEGRPVTIDEAMVLNIPVIARNVGGISEQLKEWDGGRLVEDEEEAYQCILLQMEQNKTPNIKFNPERLNLSTINKLYKIIS